MAETMSQEQLDELMSGLTKSSGESEEKDKNSSGDTASADLIAEKGRQLDGSVSLDGENENIENDISGIKKQDAENEDVDEEKTTFVTKNKVVHLHVFSVIAKQRIVVITAIMLLILSCSGIWFYFNKKTIDSFLPKTHTKSNIEKTIINKKSGKNKVERNHFISEPNESLKR